MTLTGIDPFEGKKTEEKTYGSETYVTYTETKNYASYDEIEAALLELTYDSGMFDGTDTGEDPNEEKAPAGRIFSSADISKKGGIFYSVYSFRATAEPYDSSGDTVDAPLKLTVTVTMPAKVTGCKGGGTDGNTASFDLTDIGSGTEIAAVSEVNNYGVIFAAVGILAAASLVILLLIRRKK